MPQRKLRDVIKGKTLYTADPDNTIFEAAQFMSENNIGAVVITEDKALVGIFTERDLLNRVVAKGLDVKKTKVSEVMTTDVISLDENKPFLHALLVMHEETFRHVPVLRNSIPVGIVSARDALGVEWTEYKIDAEKANRIAEIL